MIIKITPETDAEKANFTETEHENVKDFFIMGNKMDNGKSFDFQDWSGKYRFLVGSLHYFAAKIEREEYDKESAKGSNDGLSKLIKFGDTNIEAIDPDEEQEAIRKDIEALQENFDHQEAEDGAEDIEIELDVNDIKKQ